MTEPARTTLRQHARDAVRHQIATTAIDLFATHGFANVTVDDIVTAAGSSARSFHRYFASKEETVLVDAGAHGELVRHALVEALPASPWAALRSALQPLVDLTDDRALTAMRVLLSTPSLRARSVQKHQEWAVFLVPLLLRDPASDEMRARAQVLSALSCFDAALEEWVRHDGVRPVGELLDQAFASVGY